MTFAGKRNLLWKKKDKKKKKKKNRATLPNKLKISSFSSLTSSFLLQLKEILMDPKRKWFPLYLFYTLIYPDFGDDLSFQRNQVSAEGPEIFPISLHPFSPSVTMATSPISCKVRRG